MEIVFAVVFDLDPAAFFAVMNRHVGRQMLLQTIFQVVQRRVADQAGVLLAAVADRSRRAGVATIRSVVRTVELWRKTFSASRRCSSCVFKPSSDLGVTDREQTLDHPSLDLRIEIEQPHGIGDCGPALPDFLGNLFLAHPEFARQPGIGLRFLDRIELGALEILDQGKFENFEIGGLPNDDRRIGQADFLGRAPAAFAGDQFETSFTLA